MGVRVRELVEEKVVKEVICGWVNVAVGGGMVREVEER